MPFVTAVAKRKKKKHSEWQSNEKGESKAHQIAVGVRATDL